MSDHGSFSSDRTDRVLVAVCLLGVLLCSIVLISDTAFQFLFGKSTHLANGEVIGDVAFTENDVRFRPAGSLSWERAKPDQRVRSGESIFTGEKSHSQILLKNGGRVDLDQNSLVKFSEIDHIEVPDLALGNFRVTVNGQMKVAIAGEVTEISGKGSEVQVMLKPREKPKLRLLKGTAQVRTQTKTQALIPSKTVEVAEAEPVPMPIPVPAPAAAPAPVLAKILPQEFLAPLVYTDGVYDLYEQREGKLVYRKSRATLLDFSVEIPWAMDGVAEKVFGQVSGNADFANVMDSFTVMAPEQSARISKVILGTNYYRLSADNQEWTAAHRFEVVAKPLSEPPPTLKTEPKIVILSGEAALKAQIVSDLPGTIVEMSTKPNFPQGETRIKFLEEKMFVLHFTSASTIFFRLRGVDSHERVTELSNTVRVDIEKPPRAEAPQLAEATIRAFQGDELHLAWPPSAHAKRYHVKIMNSSGQAIAEKSLEGEQMVLRATTLGSFKVRVSAEDAYGRISNPSNSRGIVVSSKPLPVAAVKPTEGAKKTAEPTERKPANTGTLTEKIASPPNVLNDNLSSSNVSFETAAFTIYSQEEIQNGKSNPTAMTLGLRWLKWLGRHGFESSLLTKLIDLNTSAGSSVSPTQAEARYHYRWELPFNPFSKYGHAQISVIGGYEYYHNNTSGLFSPGYQLVKGGFDLAFPLLSRWDTGGEILYGQGFESSHKYEISGFLHYYWNKTWSIGAGYRMHLFQAGSNGATPLGLPYREGFGEGYTVMRWHY